MNYKSLNTKAGNNCTEGSTKGSQSLVDAKERLRSSIFIHSSCIIILLELSFTF